MNVQIECLHWCWTPLMFCPCMSQPGSYMLRHSVSKPPVTATFLAVCPSGGSWTQEKSVQTCHYTRNNFPNDLNLMNWFSLDTLNWINLASDVTSDLCLSNWEPVLTNVFFFLLINWSNNDLMFVVLYYCSLIVPLPVLVRKMILLIRKTAFLSWLGWYKSSKSYRSSCMSFFAVVFMT